MICQKQNILGANSIGPADSIPNVFSTHRSVVPLFLVRKVENKRFPCTHKLSKRTGQVWRDNSRRVRTHENNSRETVHRLGTIIQSFFVPNQEPASAWIFGNSSVRVDTQRLFRPYLKTFVPPFLPTWSTDCPWVSEDAACRAGCRWFKPRTTVRRFPGDVMGGL